MIFAGKAASAYHTAKLIIRLAHDIARVVNADPRVGGRLKLVFLPNYGVRLAEVIIPAADLSEQISTAGTEASGTGNMKFALNGALTIGTWDGANIEMAQAMGARQHVRLRPARRRGRATCARPATTRACTSSEKPALQRVLDAIAGGAFSPDEPGRYRGLIDGLLSHDNYMLLADFAVPAGAGAGRRAVRRPGRLGAPRARATSPRWARFSSDRTVRDYLERVWSRPDDRNRAPSR